MLFSNGALEKKKGLLQNVPADTCMVTIGMVWSGTVSTKIMTVIFFSHSLYF